MLASVGTYTLIGVEAREVTVEVDVGSGLPSFSVVGLPDAAVRESRERVRAAVTNSGFEFPQRRITASLAPADLRKAGPGFDLAIAAALLAALGQIRAEVLTDCAVAAELALDGTVRPVPGALAMAERANARGVGRIVVAAESAYEAGLPGSLAGAGQTRVVPVERLADLSRLGAADEPCFSAQVLRRDPPESQPQIGDMADLRGQPVLRQALETAAAGGHGVLILGPPGAGKSMAARRLPTIMPELSDAEAIEVLRISSACGRSRPGAAIARPFRAPHHTISPAGLVGGGTQPRPGEVTLAHRGVLFLDELGEFSRSALEALRQPLEDGEVTITRARQSITLPCRFMLIAASNPCPCGFGEDSPSCRCSPGAASRYRHRISGALADRIDISLLVEQPDPDSLTAKPEEGSGLIRERVTMARELALDRQGCINAELGPTAIRKQVLMTASARAALVAGHARMGLSGRGHDRILRVARTLADLERSKEVDAVHIAGALGYRRRSGE